MKHLSPLQFLKEFIEHFQKNKTFAWLVSGYILFSLLLFFYSFTQIDLNLTLISYPLIHAIQKPFIYLGYFQRSLSTSLYLGLLMGFFVLFLSTLWMIHKKKIQAWEVGAIITVMSGLLLFSYPAFSHDIFNYMFDAKIFTFYGDNPYAMRAIDYPEDPWIRFMHWTHRTYPYGPVFLPVSIILSYVGMNIFPLTLMLFKVMMIGAYLGTTYFIYKISQKKLSDFALPATAFFALNPLVIFETLVSAHHDIVMMFFAVLAVDIYLSNKKAISFVLFLLSVGIKYVTVFLAPLYILGFRPFILLLGAIAATTAVILRLGLQPWYLLWVLPFVAFMYPYMIIRLLTIVLSAIFLLRYVPFLYTGEWPSEMLTLHNQLVVISIVSTMFGYGIWWGINRKNYGKK